MKDIFRLRSVSGHWNDHGELTFHLLILDLNSASCLVKWVPFSILVRLTVGQLPSVSEVDTTIRTGDRVLNPRTIKSSYTSLRLEKSDYSESFFPISRYFSLVIQTSVN